MAFGPRRGSGGESRDSRTIVNAIDESERRALVMKKSASVLTARTAVTNEMQVTLDRWPGQCQNPAGLLTCKGGPRLCGGAGLGASPSKYQRLETRAQRRR